MPSWRSAMRRRSSTCARPRTRRDASTACTPLTRTSASSGRRIREPVLSPKDAAAPTLEQARRAGLLPVYADCEAYLGSLREAADARTRELAGYPAAGGLLRGHEFRKGAMQRRPPVADRRNAGRRGPGAVTQHAVGGPRRRPGQRAARYRPYPGRIGAEQAEDLAGQPEPGGLPAARGMVDARRGRGMDQRDDLRGDVGGPGGLAVLVVHHVDRRPLVLELDHRADEVRPVRPVQPCRPDHIADPGRRSSTARSPASLVRP